MNSMEKTISVIVPVYNVQAYLNRCIESIVNQLYTDLEIILVDDGSTDQSGSICDSWEEKDKRIKVLHKSNGGLSAARNIGLEAATGEYICFIDSDDYLDRNMVLKLYQAITEHDADVAMCEFEKEEEHGGTVIWEHPNEKVCHIYEKNSILPLIYENDFLNKSTIIVAWNKMYRANLFEDIRYPEGRLHEDEYVIHQVLYKSKKMVYIPECYYHYMQRKNSITSSKSDKKIEDMLYAYEVRMQFLVEKNELDLCQKTLQEWMYKAKRSCAYCSEKKHIKKAVRRTLLKMHKEYIIVGIRFWKDLAWTYSPV